MLAVIENAREIVDCETPSVRATSSAVTWAPAFVIAAFVINRLAIVLLVSGEIVRRKRAENAGNYLQYSAIATRCTA